MTSLFELVRQVHYLEPVDGGERLVTIQRWDAKRSPARRSIHVVAHDGVPHMFKLRTTGRLLQELDDQIRQAQETRELLDERAAREWLRARTGHVERECSRRWCSGAVPVAADRCEYGHTFSQSSGGVRSQTLRKGEIHLPPAGGSHG